VLSNVYLGAGMAPPNVLKERAAARRKQRAEENLAVSKIFDHIHVGGAFTSRRFEELGEADQASLDLRDKLYKLRDALYKVTVLRDRTERTLVPEGDPEDVARDVLEKYFGGRVVTVHVENDVRVVDDYEDDPSEFYVSKKFKPRIFYKMLVVQLRVEFFLDNQEYFNRHELAFDGAVGIEELGPDVPPDYWHVRALATENLIKRNCEPRPLVIKADRVRQLLFDLLEAFMVPVNAIDEFMITWNHHGTV